MKHRTARPLLLAALAAACSSVAGCANVGPTRTGFLQSYGEPPSATRPSIDTVHVDAPDYDPEPSTRQSDAVYYVEPGEIRVASPRADLRGIDSFYIEAVNWIPTRSTSLRDDPRARQQLLDDLRAALERKLSGINRIVDHPGPKTARVRAAITEAQKADLTLNIIGTLLVGPVSNGGATIEAEVLRPKGRQIAAVDYSEEGGPLDQIGYYVTDDHIKKASHDAAELLVQALLGNPGPPEQFRQRWRGTRLYSGGGLTVYESGWANRTMTNSQ